MTEHGTRQQITYGGSASTKFFGDLCNGTMGKSAIFSQRQQKHYGTWMHIPPLWTPLGLPLMGRVLRGVRGHEPVRQS